jgi:hypothetical protein
MEEILEEEKALGRWPRRLLYVPTLTSYKWQPGNIYGNTTSPSYNALTYTWGRWKLRDGDSPEKPEIAALPVQGTDWPIPRINPDHFTSDDFEAVISSVATCKPDSGPPRRDHCAVDFVWLDIACIDQRASELGSSAEIGRQAVIFQNANIVYAWLTTQTLELGQHYIESLERFPEIVDTAPQQDQKAMIQNVEKFLSDPWFSSLWTLQEAFLRPDAFVLSKSGQLFTYQLTAATSVNPDLTLFFDWGRAWCFACAEKASQTFALGYYDDAMQLIQRSGLDALSTLNAIATYFAASQRMTKFAEDRIYGIQQVFGFRLGKSALNQSLGQSFSLDELENQLGEEMVKTYPVLSQFHIFTEHVPKERRWRINRCSIVPTWVSDHGHSVWEAGGYDEAKCKFWFDGVLGAVRTVCFEGRTSPLARLLEACEETKQEELFNTLPVLSDMFRVVPDVAEELAGSPERSGQGYHSLVTGSRQRHLTKWLVDEFPRRKLQVLWLGPSTGETYSYHLGLLLLNCGGTKWTRLGICQWDVTNLQISDIVSSHIKYFCGEGSGWSLKRGTLGSLYP